MKPVRNQNQIAGVRTVEVAEIEVIGNIEEDSVDETEAAVTDPLDEQFPPDNGGSE